MIPYSFHPEAEAEFADAARFYESRGIFRRKFNESFRIFANIQTQARRHAGSSAGSENVGRSISIRHCLSTRSRVNSHSCRCASAATAGLLAPPTITPNRSRRRAFLLAGEKESLPWRSRWLSGVSHCRRCRRMTRDEQRLGDYLRHISQAVERDSKLYTQGTDPVVPVGPGMLIKLTRIRVSQHGSRHYRGLARRAPERRRSRACS